MSLLGALSLFCAAAGTIAFLSMVWVRHSAKQCLLLALDFWMAAGLIRLSATSAWSAIATSAAIIVIRKVVNLTLEFHGQRRTLIHAFHQALERNGNV